MFEAHLDHGLIVADGGVIHQGPGQEIPAMNRALRRLTQDELDGFQANGFVAPVTAFGSEEAVHYRDCLEAFEQKTGTAFMKFPETPTIFSKSHLLFGWVDTIVRHPAILDAIEDIIGPNIRVFHNNIFVKEPHTPTFVSWHQDGSYNGIMPPDVLTAWVALTESSFETGCVRILRGSHKPGHRVHVDRRSADNMLSRGQQIETIEIETGAVAAGVADMTLRPGEMSLHHTYAVHCSVPNRRAQRRIGVMTTYMPTHCRYVGSGTARMRAALVRGHDEYGHFDDEPRPILDFGPAERAAHHDSCERYIANVTASENKWLNSTKPAVSDRHERTA